MDSIYSWPPLITTLLQHKDLPATAATWAMEEIIAGRAKDAQIIAFVVALRAKGETAAEVEALLQVMLARATAMSPLPHALDVVGTGGDGANTANISTMAAVVVAAMGVPVVKHGSRAASSACGASDLLAALGVQPDMSPEQVVKCVEEVGIGFCFAPRFHPGLRHAAEARRSLGVPTVFNILGPLANPASPKASVVGCAEARMAPVMADVLKRRGDTGVVLRSEDGLDECVPTAPTRLWLVEEGKVQETILDPLDLGVSRVELAALRGGDPATNAEIAHTVFAGEEGPVTDAVVLNAALAFTVHLARQNPGVLKDDASFLHAVTTNMERARKVLASQAAEGIVQRWADVARLSTNPVALQ